MQELEDRLKRLEGEEALLEFSKNNGTFITGKTQEEEEGEKEEEVVVAVLGGGGNLRGDMLAPRHALTEAVGDVLVEEETWWEHAAALVGDDDLRRIYAAALGYAALVRPLL